MTFTSTKTPMTAVHERQKHQIDTLMRAAREVIAADDAAESDDPDADRRWDRAMGALAAAVAAIGGEEA